MNLHDNVLRLECDLLHFSIFFWRLALNLHSAIHRGHVQVHKDVIPKCKLDKTYHLVLNQLDFFKLETLLWGGVFDCINFAWLYDRSAACGGSGGQKK